MEEVRWGAFGVAQPLEGAGGERGASYLPLQVGGDVSDLDLSAPAKTKPWVTVTGGQRLPEAFWEREGETLRRHPASRAACCRSPAVPSITWWLSVEKPKRMSVEEAPGGERRFQPRVVPPRGIARAPQEATATQRLPRHPAARRTRAVLGQNSHTAHPEQHLQSFLSQFPPPDCYFFPFCCYFQPRAAHGADTQLHDR